MSTEQEIIRKNSKFISYTIDFPIIAGKIPEEIKTIRVVGDFGSWSGWLDMKKANDGSKYSADVSVRPGTTISYKFLINGNIWTSIDADKTVVDQDGHTMIVKKVLDTDDSSLKSKKSEVKVTEKEVTKKVQTPATTVTSTTKDTNQKKEKKQKKSFFKKLFSCCC
ncbi:hypothetical protein H8356DRAFT_1089827 [Neocallimastix lanati (nom. inval.)]|jgi:hypothetical protein|nr:hypothetical protein H8356DRAFT_971836 [Neocallimastix sp. JGI-2020a]KAG4083037.1 hypothetical protein H8356DRAFT_1089827 [Neocallimastix sp. JGI-2020a]